MSKPIVQYEITQLAAKKGTNFITQYNFGEVIKFKVSNAKQHPSHFATTTCIFKVIPRKFPRIDIANAPAPMSETVVETHPNGVTISYGLQQYPKSQGRLTRVILK